MISKLIIGKYYNLLVPLHSLLLSVINTYCLIEFLPGVENVLDHGTISQEILGLSENISRLHYFIKCFSETNFDEK